MATNQIPQADIIQPDQSSLRNRLADREFGGKYSVSQLTFPSDLFSSGASKYANCWMMININILEQSKYASQLATANLSAAEEAERQSRRQTGADVRNQSGGELAAQLVASGAAAGAAAGIAELRMKDFLAGGRGGAQQAAVRALQGVGARALQGAGLAGALGGAVIANAEGLVRRETRRLAGAIVLPMPNALTTAYNMRWDEDPTNLFDLMARGLSNVTSGALDALAAQSLNAQGIVQSRGLSAATGLAANPKKEIYFDSVNFRNFQMQYRMFPKTPAEAQIIKNIIFQLKFHMHPEYKSEGRYTFVYPSEFDISFYKRDAENLWVNKIATSVLTDLQVNYTPDSAWVAHEDGQPNAVDISMTFRELTIMTKETIIQGY